MRSPQDGAGLRGLVSLARNTQRCYTLSKSFSCCSATSVVCWVRHILLPTASAPSSSTASARASSTASAPSATRRSPPGARERAISRCPYSATAIYRTRLTLFAMRRRQYGRLRRGLRVQNCGLPGGRAAPGSHRSHPTAAGSPLHQLC